MLDKIFKLKKLATTPQQEIIAGLTTFVTMAYIIVVNPKILEAACLPFGPSMVATIISAFFGCLLMGFYAKRPIAIAPYMGENAFIAFTVVKVMGYSWQTALGAIFISGVLFTLLTVLKLRSWFARAIPQSLKIGFAAGIGLFLAFIGLNETGIVGLGVPGAPVKVGNFHDPNVLLGIFSFLFIGWLMSKRVKGAILVGIIVTSLLAFITGLAKLPAQLFSMPPALTPILFKLDIMGALSWGTFPVILTVFVMAFVDTLGTLLGLALKADLLDKNGELPHIEKPMLADALATVFAALVGTTTSGAYIESATGIESGGKSGLTAVVVGLLFLLALFCAPLLSAVPSCAYGPALIIVGMLMLSPLRKLDFEDLSELLPVFCIIALMSFTYNLGIGMTASFVVYPLIKTLTGKRKQVHTGMWILGAFSLLFFIFYPYN